MKQGEKGCEMWGEKVGVQGRASFRAGGGGGRGDPPQSHHILTCLATCGHLLSPFPLSRELGGVPHQLGRSLAPQYSHGFGVTRAGVVQQRG